MEEVCNIVNNDDRIQLVVARNLPKFFIEDGIRSKQSLSRIQQLQHLVGKLWQVCSARQVSLVAYTTPRKQQPAGELAEVISTHPLTETASVCMMYLRISDREKSEAIRVTTKPTGLRKLVSDIEAAGLCTIYNVDIHLVQRYFLSKGLSGVGKFTISTNDDCELEEICLENVDDTLPICAEEIDLDVDRVGEYEQGLAALIRNADFVNAKNAKMMVEDATMDVMERERELSKASLVLKPFAHYNLKVAKDRLMSSTLR